jgi:hypothetical protein
VDGKVKYGDSASAAVPVALALLRRQLQGPAAPARDADPLPTGHTAQPSGAAFATLLRNEPAAQVTQVVIPGAEYVPAAQERQAVAPKPAIYVPAAHTASKEGGR